MRTDPFVVALEKSKNKFVDNVEYYNYPEQTEFLDTYDALMENIYDSKAVKTFMDHIISNFIMDTYHINSYLQEGLVNINKACHELMQSITGFAELDDFGASSEVLELFNRLIKFKPDLESSLIRGTVKGGILRKRSLTQWTVIVPFK